MYICLWPKWCNGNRWFQCWCRWHFLEWVATATCWIRYGYIWRVAIATGFIYTSQQFLTFTLMTGSLPLLPASQESKSWSLVKGFPWPVFVPWSSRAQDKSSPACSCFLSEYLYRHKLCGFWSFPSPFGITFRYTRISHRDNEYNDNKINWDCSDKQHILRSSGRMPTLLS